MPENRAASGKKFRIVLAGNPNVGKSTVFNELTGLRQHTGNWTGKTVSLSSGTAVIEGNEFEITDLPGAYSMSGYSDEEKLSSEYLRENKSDCAVLVADAGVLERNLCYLIEVLALCGKAVLCLNMSDEAEKNGIKINSGVLSAALGIPVVKTAAAKKRGLDKLRETILLVCEGNLKAEPSTAVFADIALAENREKRTELLSKRSADICGSCVEIKSKRAKAERTGKIDRVLTSKYTGIPIILLLFGILFWITAVGANYPSEWLGILFDRIKQLLNEAALAIDLPEEIRGLLVDGVYTTLAWVISVMLPPMAIFFPLFSLLEDSGYLPRIAFNFDRCFACCGAHGKQSLTMMMGMGCNACGVTGCRIIENPKEKLIAILTNNLMPCNGRLPILIAVIIIFFAGGSSGFAASSKTAAAMVLILALSVAATLGMSKLLSKTLGDGSPSDFALELPPYRRPQLGRTLVRTLLDRTVFVLGRAAAVAAPAGAVIWLMANIKINDLSVLKYCTDFLDPFGRLIGLDGVIVMALILGFPANETVIPIIIMSYVSGSAMQTYTGYGELSALLSANGWNAATAVCMIIMTIMRFPCSTTCLTIKKETGSLKWTAVSVLLPTVSGIVLCAAVANIMRLF